MKKLIKEGSAMNSFNLFASEVKTTLAENLFSSTASDCQSPTTFLEQYKLVVDASNKTDERRVSVNNFFITINGIFVPFLMNTFPLDKPSYTHFVPLFILTCVGLVISFEWISVMNIYKRLNYINHSTIKAFEEKLPSYAFSIRTDMLAKQTSTPKANAILNSEMLIPKLFIGIYIIYFISSPLAFWLR